MRQIRVKVLMPFEPPQLLNVYVLDMHIDKNHVDSPVVTVHGVAPRKSASS